MDFGEEQSQKLRKGEGAGLMRNSSRCIGIEDGFFKIRERAFFSWAQPSIHARSMRQTVRRMATMLTFSMIKAPPAPQSRTTS